MKAKERTAIFLLAWLVVREAAPCSVAHCLPAKCQDLGGQGFRCLGCEEGFFLREETACQACPQGCAKCSASGLCLACLEGYALKAAAGCAPCGPHCAKCDEKACLVCAEGSFELAEGTCRSAAATASSISGPTIGYILLGVFVGLFLLFLIRVNFVKKKSAEVRPATKEPPAKGILKSSDGDTSRLGGRLVTTGETNLGEAALHETDKRGEADTKASSSSHPTKLTLRSTQNRLAQVRLAEEPTQPKDPEPELPAALLKEDGSEKPVRPQASPNQSPQLLPVIVRKIPVNRTSRSPPKDARRSPNLKLAQRKVLGSGIQRVSFPYLSKKPAGWRAAGADEVPRKEGSSEDK